MTLKLESRDTKWSPLKALGHVDNLVEELGIPKFNFDLESAPILEFSDLMNADNPQIEKFLVLYGGYKAYLESQLADCDAKRSALEAAFDEGLATAMYKLNSEREAISRKPTKDEVRGEALDTYPQLRELRREVIEQDSLHKKLSGLLNTYKAAYDAVSRVVALRTWGAKVE